MQIPIISPSSSLPNVLVVNRPSFATAELKLLTEHANIVDIEQEGREGFIPKLEALVRSTPGGIKACCFFMRWSGFQAPGAKGRTN